MDGALGPLNRWQEAIVPNDERISCGECTKSRQMGIDVRAFARRERPLGNESTSCIFCGICATVCPVNVLKVERLPGGT